jgi:hypothetical protein
MATPRAYVHGALPLGLLQHEGAPHSAARARPRAARWGIAVLWAGLSLGCAGHSAKTLEARQALDAGRPKRALELYNKALDVETPKDLPEDLGGEASLLLLDRSMVLQQLEDFELSSRDLEVADKQIEMLDFSRTAVADIGKYIFSDDAGAYRAPPYEKLMINTMNMVNYLARGDLNGARIEARRLAVIQKYLRDNESSEAAMMAPGSYFAGFVFEKSGRPDEALRYYDEALQYSTFPSLVEPVRRLSEKSSYTTPRLKKLLEGAGESAKPSVAAATFSAEQEGSDTATAPDRPTELLVIINYGRVPAKVAQRIPIGLALTYASGAISPTDAARANHLAAQGLVTWVNYPELEKTRRTLATPSLSVNGQWQTLEGALAVDREARKAFEEHRGAIVASAITRMISRIVAGEATRAAAGRDSLLGVLLSLGTQAALTAADTPDTRSWSTLPARIAIGRTTLRPGKHEVVLQAQGVRRRAKIDLKPGDWAVLSLTVLE